MNNWAKILVGVGLLWYGVLRGARGLIVGIKSFSFKSISIEDGTVSLYLNFAIKNPLFIGLKLRSLVGDIYAQGQKVGDVNTTIDYYLSGGRTHIVPVVVNLDVRSLGQAAILNIQSGDIRTLTIAFAGKMYVGGANVGVPVQMELDYNGLVK